MNASSLKAVTSSVKTGGKDEWGTPRKLLDKLEKVFGKFDLDPCADATNAVASRYFTKAENGLVQPWFGNVFMNPPYSAIKDWLAKAFAESHREGVKRVICLVPARTDSRWFHAWATRGDVYFLKGRLKFIGGLHGAPFPSCLIQYQKGDAVQMRVTDWRTW
jgi:phage N-6-adenine-methyltransferase